MKKKKLKKKYKQLIKDYESLEEYTHKLFCENARLRSKDLEQLTDKQILIGSAVCEKLNNAIKAVYGEEAS